MHFIKEINSLDLLYYEYNNKTNILMRDTDYSNKYIELEFFKLTYSLSEGNIPFTVLKDKSIKLEKTKFDLVEYYSKILESFNNFNKNIFLLNDKKVKWAKNIPLFKIVYMEDNIDLSSYDILIFTSKNAVKAINKINDEWKEIPSYVISEQTAKLVKDFNGKVEYVSTTKHGDEFGYEIADKIKGKKVLYLRGEEIVSDIINILKNNQVNCTDKIIYKNRFNEAVEKIKIPKNSKIVFTSPSTIKYFFKVFSWDESFTAISIGKTTAQYFPKEIVPIIADNISFKSCVDKALEIT